MIKVFLQNPYILDNKIFVDGYYIYVDIYVYMYNLGGIITARG